MPANQHSRAAADPRAGEVIAERYRILSLAGFGRVSSVYKAEDLLTANTVAVKLIRASPELDASSISTYRSDLNIFRNSQHPGLVRVFDSGDHLDELYVVMEWLSGPAFRDCVAVGEKLAFDVFEKLYTDVADALASLHAQRFSHRDIHPGNVMCSESGAWKLMDFGIDRDRRRTRESVEAEYAAPEQIMRQRSTLATDVYSFGAIAFRALIGRPPVRSGMSPVRVEGPLNGAPLELGPILETCLQLDPAKRFQNIQALQSATDRLIAARQSSNARQLSDWARAEPGEPETLIPLFVRMARALSQLHDAGLEHGELSPKSIRIVGDRVLFETRGAGADGATPHATLMIADAKYAAPELVVARKAPDSAAHIRGDVYVLGFLFYELLVGHDEMRRQFAENEQMQTGLAWMRWHADPNARLRPLAEAVPTCPKGLAEIVDRMTAKDAALRPDKLEDVTEAIEKLTFVLARTQPFAIGATLGSKRNRRKPRHGAVAATILLLAATALAVKFVLPSRDWLGAAGGVWTRTKERIGAGNSARAASLPDRLQTASGAMGLVPQGATRIASFYIDQTEVVNRLFRDFCARTGRVLPDPPDGDPGYFHKDGFPVVNVDREAASAYCRDAGKRLPTEQEWERAAGAGESSILWGNWTLAGLANLRKDDRGRPAAAGTYSADISPFGMLDAAGNVREWVAEDPNSESLTGVIKGGSYNSPAEGLSPSARITAPLNRSGVDLSDVGFRCAVDARLGPALAAHSR